MSLHERNLHRDGYNFKELIGSLPELAEYVRENEYSDLSIDFGDSQSVIMLNKALLKHHYEIENWDVPKEHLCPPIPGRVDYLHYIADLLAQDNNGSIPVGTKVKGLDIGTGTTCIYPILGNSVYGWKFVATDTSTDAINHSKLILSANKRLKKNIKTRFQNDQNLVFKNIFKQDEVFDFTMCNPPFYSSQKEANESSARKQENLDKNRKKKGHAPLKSSSNFGGKNNELWCEGGEFSFISKMIDESVNLKDKSKWFSSLVSKKENLEGLVNKLKSYKCRDVRTIQMSQGQKISHILAWSY